LEGARDETVVVWVFKVRTHEFNDCLGVDAQWCSQIVQLCFWHRLLIQCCMEEVGLMRLCIFGGELIGFNDVWESFIE
jgi:hypothetical protein